MKGEEPSRVRPTERVSRRFSVQRRTGTEPELLLRRELHRRGRRFRVHYLIPGVPRRRADLVFTRWRVAVFVDGCFWHACAEHGVKPNTNSDWWQWKLDNTRARDRDTDQRLSALGWTAVRVWEHEAPASAADRIENLLNQLALGRV
nr:DNA mismatch endonuclease Vsr [Cellulomonas sp. URHD0024]